MSNTGERFIPTMDLQLALEHWHRYSLVLPLVDGLSVVDVACGDGYGSDLLASRAANVLGIDIDDASVELARHKYVRPNLAFRTGSVQQLDLPDASVDVVVSFETFEHVDAEVQTAFLSEVRRVLRPGGSFIVSTPDKRTYSTNRNYANPFHVAELDRDDFERLLRERFAHVDIGLQKCAYLSLVTEASAPLESVSIRLDDEGAFAPGSEPLAYEYVIAVCSDDETSTPFRRPSVAFDEQVLTNTHDRRLEYILGLGGVIERERSKGDALWTRVEALRAEVEQLRGERSEYAALVEQLHERSAEQDAAIRAAIVERDRLRSVLASPLRLVGHVGAKSARKGKKFFARWRKRIVTKLDV